MPFLLVMRLLIMVQRVSRHVMVTVVLQVSSTTQGIMSVTRMGFMVHFTVTVMPIVSNYPHAIILLPTFARMASPVMVDYRAPTRLSKRSIGDVMQNSDAGRRDIKEGMWEVLSAAVMMPRLAAF